jgi:hypothetical protein
VNGRSREALLAIGLVLAFTGGVLGSKLIAAYQALNGVKSGARLAAGTMRAARLRWLIWAVKY